MRASYGTLQLLGLKPGGYPFTPKTAFLLVGEGCIGSCTFCPQAQGIDNKISRITWPTISDEDFYHKIKNTFVDRICIQAVRNNNVFEEVIAVLKKVSKTTETAVSVSMNITSNKQAKELFDNGADIVSIALDCATPKLVNEIKSISFNGTKDLLIRLSKNHPGKINTHLIAGLGETDRELLELAKKLIDSGVSVSLFAFTPIKGTPMEKVKPPALSRYRRLQVGMALLRVKRSSNIVFNNDGSINHLCNFRDAVKPNDFQTPGCPGCNRPYYNERPGGTMYHYPNPPNIDDMLEEIE